MIRFAWLQFRTQAVVAICGLAAIATFLALTGPHLAHLYDTRIATCASHGDCSTVTPDFLRTDHTLQSWLVILVVVVPGLIGVFWGAPLVARELETGTFRLAWTQSVTSTRWLAMKVVLVGLASVVVAELLSLMATWWFSPLDRVNMNAFGTFDQRDIVPIGYAAFAFALGVTAGTMIRRMLPAMAATLAGFVAVRVAFAQWIRPRLIAPAHLNLALNPTATGYGSTNAGPYTLFPEPPNIANAWIYSTRIVDKTGQALRPQLLASVCPKLGAARSSGPPPPVGVRFRGPAPAQLQTALQDCVRKVGVTYHEVVTYQPADRYWTFQWYELAIFLGAAFALGALCFWWVRHRLS